MDKITILKSDGTTLAEVPINSNSELIRELMGQDVVKVYFDSPVPVNIVLGDYIELWGSRYVINTFPVVHKTAERMLQYEATFEGVLYEFGRVSFFDQDANGVHLFHEFYITGNLSLFAQLLQNNMRRVFPEWSVTRQDDHLGEEVKTLSFSENNCQQALASICEAYEVEYQYSATGGDKAFTFVRQAGEDKKITLEYGKDNGLYDLERQIATANNLTTRLYAFGSSKNIGANYRGFSPRLRMPDVDIFVEITNIEHRYQETYIYGKTNAWNVKLQTKVNGEWQDYGETLPGSIYNVYHLTYIQPPDINEFRVKAWNSGSSYRYSDGTGSGWTAQVDYIESPNIGLLGVFERTVIFDDIFPEREGTVTQLGETVYKFADSGMFDLKAKDGGDDMYLLPGIEPKVIFRSGNLAGYEFAVLYDHPTRMFTMKKYIDERGMVFPSETETAFQLQGGEKYSLVDIRMPDEYIAEAEERLYDRALAWVGKYGNYQVIYTLGIDPFYVMENGLPLDIGDSFQLLDQPLDIDQRPRIRELRRNLVQEYSYGIGLGDSIFEPKARGLQRTVSNAADAQLKIGGGIQSDWEEQDPNEPSYIKNKPDLSLIADKNLVLPVNYKLFEVIAHNLGKKPAVSVLDSDNTEGLADIEHIDDNTVKVTFSDYFTGKIVFN